MTLDVRLRHAFGDFRLDVAFSAPPGVTALFGRSGSGKTSVANAVAGLLDPAEGRVALDGAVLYDSAAGLRVPPHRRRIGYVFQEGRLFPHLTVRQNLTFGAWFAPRGARLPRFDAVVDLLGIGALLDRRPGRLSGGEKQRVAIGRALLSGPAALVMDEPLAALDDARKAEILPYLERLRDETRAPILYVSHAVAEVARLATTLVVMEAGRVVRSGPAAALLGAPGDGALWGRDEAGGILRARVAEHDAAFGLTALDAATGRIYAPRAPLPVGASVRLRVRARDVIVSLTAPQGLSALNALPAVVAEIGPDDGAAVDVALAIGPDRILARITRRSLWVLGLRPGMDCHAILKSVAIDDADLARGVDDGARAPVAAD